MALPKIDVPIYEITLPLSKKKIKYRPFLVKEEKILLMAVESNDEKTVVDAIKQIVNNCCFNEVDIENMPVTDMEYLFLQLRSKSVGEIVDLQYRCNNNVKDENGEEKKCNNVVKFELNVSDIVPDMKDHSNKIELSSELGMIMRYPNFSMIEEQKDLPEVEKIMDIIIKCIDSVYDKDSVYHRKDITKEEMKEFVESLTQSQFTNVQKFFENIPTLKKEVHFKCNKCGYEENIILQGIQNFFG